MSEQERRDLALRLFGSGKPGEPGPLHPGWVERHLAGSRMQLKRWREKGIPQDRVQDVLDAVTALMPDTEKDAPPEWARRLTKELRTEILTTRTVVAETLAREIGQSVGADLDRLLSRLLDERAP